MLNRVLIVKRLYKYFLWCILSGFRVGFVCLLAHFFHFMSCDHALPAVMMGSFYTVMFTF